MLRFGSLMLATVVAGCDGGGKESTTCASGFELRVDGNCYPEGDTGGTTDSEGDTDTDTDTDSDSDADTDTDTDADADSDSDPDTTLDLTFAGDLTMLGSETLEFCFFEVHSEESLTDGGTNFDPTIPALYSGPVDCPALGSPTTYNVSMSIDGSGSAVGLFVLADTDSDPSNGIYDTAPYEANALAVIDGGSYNGIDFELGEASGEAETIIVEGTLSNEGTASIFAVCTLSAWDLSTLTGGGTGYDPTLGDALASVDVSCPSAGTSDTYATILAFGAASSGSVGLFLTIDEDNDATNGIMDLAYLGNPLAVVDSGTYSDVDFSFTVEDGSLSGGASTPETITVTGYITNTGTADLADCTLSMWDDSALTGGGTGFDDTSFSAVGAELVSCPSPGGTVAYSVSVSFDSASSGTIGAFLTVDENGDPSDGDFTEDYSGNPFSVVDGGTYTNINFDVAVDEGDLGGAGGTTDDTDPPAEGETITLSGTITHTGSATLASCDLSVWDTTALTGGGTGYNPGAGSSLALEGVTCPSPGGSVSYSTTITLNEASTGAIGAFVSVDENSDFSDGIQEIAYTGNPLSIVDGGNYTNVNFVVTADEGDLGGGGGTDDTGPTGGDDTGPTGGDDTGPTTGSGETITVSGSITNTGTATLLNCDFSLWDSTALTGGGTGVNPSGNSALAIEFLTCPSPGTSTTYSVNVTLNEASSGSVGAFLTVDENGDFSDGVEETWYSSNPFTIVSGGNYTNVNFTVSVDDGDLGGTGGGPTDDTAPAADDTGPVADDTGPSSGDDTGPTATGETITISGSITSTGTATLLSCELSLWDATALTGGGTAVNPAGNSSLALESLTCPAAGTSVTYSVSVTLNETSSGSIGAFLTVDENADFSDGVLETHYTGNAFAVVDGGRYTNVNFTVAVDEGDLGGSGGGGGTDDTGTGGGTPTGETITISGTLTNTGTATLSSCNLTIWDESALTGGGTGVNPAGNSSLASELITCPTAGTSVSYTVTTQLNETSSGRVGAFMTVDENTDFLDGVEEVAYSSNPFSIVSGRTYSSVNFSVSVNTGDLGGSGGGVGDDTGTVGGDTGTVGDDTGAGGGDTGVTDGETVTISGTVTNSGSSVMLRCDLSIWDQAALTGGGTGYSPAGFSSLGFQALASCPAPGTSVSYTFSGTLFSASTGAVGVFLTTDTDTNFGNGGVVETGSTRNPLTITDGGSYSNVNITF